MVKTNPVQIRLNANENIYGCSPKVLQWIRKNIRNINLYHGIPCRLEEKLAEKFGTDSKNIVAGAGSVRLIDGIIQTFAEHDEEILIFERSFAAYEQLARAHRRTYFLVKQTGFTCDVENIFPLITGKTKIIFIANPNNPTGTIITHAQIEYLLKNVPGKIVVVLDEAYCDYVDDTSFPGSLLLQKKYPNLIILRTFSKIYGLAGLRIGYAIAEDNVAGALKQFRIPFFFNSLSEGAALAALDDEEFVKRCAMKNNRERKFLIGELKSAGYNVIPSQANFLYVYFESDAEKENVFKNLADAGILTCNMSDFGQSHSLRIGIGNRKMNLQIGSCLRQCKFQKI